MPLRNDELNYIKLLRSDESMLEDVCSICCDNFKAKQLVRKMPACSHSFHKECIDAWLTKKPTCPNCNRNVRESGGIIQDELL